VAAGEMRNKTFIAPAPSVGWRCRRILLTLSAGMHVRLSLIALPQKRLIAALGVFFTIFVYKCHSHTQHNNIYARGAH
jgi:hypothetical protein